MSKALELLAHPDELRAALILKYIRKPLFSTQDTTATPELRRCYELLNLTSRSFAAVIKELHPELRNVVMLFYLVLRALDTVEDDMTLDPKLKVKLLREFDSKLDTLDWSFDKSGPNEKDRDVLIEFPCILKEYHALKPAYQKIIKEITKKMGNGMADYILDDNFNLNGVQTVKDYDLYCHYVAGLVGDGLTQMIVHAEFGTKDLYEGNEELYENMGLFLQKTNIIRDYAEDLEDKRSFWPREIWSQYADALPDFAKPGNTEKGLQCINALVLNALSHVTDVLTFLSSVHEQSTFQFCAIPQVMAVATLDLVCNNPDVLHKNVKIRKGSACRLILESRTLRGCVAIFQRHLRSIKRQIPVQDPNYLKINIQVAKIEQFIEEMYQEQLPPNVRPQETPVFKRTQERSRCDALVAPKEKEESATFTLACFTVCALAAAVIFYNFK